MAKCVQCGRQMPGLSFGKPVCVWCRQHEAAQRGESSEYQPVMPTPWQRSEALPTLATQAIFGLNAMVFLGMVLSGSSPMMPTGLALVQWGANWGPLTLQGQWWRLISSCFVHIGIIHLAMNMWCLWSLGGLAERLYGRLTFTCVYFLCGVSGSLASVWWHRMPTVSAGASGAIFGLAGAVIASMKLGEFADHALARGVQQSLMGFVGYNVVFGALTGITDNACHIGGLLAGLVLGALIAKLAPAPRLLPRLGILLSLAVVLVGVFHWLQVTQLYHHVR